MARAEVGNIGGASPSLTERLSDLCKTLAQCKSDSEVSLVRLRGGDGDAEKSAATLSAQPSNISAWLDECESLLRELVGNIQHLNGRL